jgi:hypothetical protein
MRIASRSSAGSTPLPRKPLAPARIAPTTSSSVSKVVSMTTRTPAMSSSVVIWRVAVMPSMSGMRMSIKTTSARLERVSETASAPVAASATTVRSGAESMSTLNPARMRAWSSASTTRIVIDRRR